LEEKPVREVLPIRESSFSIKKVASPRVTRIQYDVTLDELNRVRKHIGKSREPAAKVGRMTLDYYFKKEGL
jgi:hypothetical protein